jgi:hypothetical protein
VIQEIREREVSEEIGKEEKHVRLGWGSA